MKKGKLLRLLALIAMAAAIAVGSAGCSGCAEKGKPDPDPAAGGYDVKYATTMPSGTDDGIMIDGKLDETAYAEQKTFVNRLSEDSDGNMERLSMTTYVGDKGWYVLTEVTDSALVYNGLLAPARNSTIHLYYELASENANEAIREIYMDAGRVYGRTPCNIGLMEYGVKVNGELNGATTGMTAELFIPWRAMGLTEKPENTDLLMYPMYSIPKGGGDYRNLSPLPNLSYVANQFYLFGSDGYSDKDADGAILGDAKNGHVKAGVWTYTDVEKTEADGKVTLSGSAGVHAGSYAKTYIKDIVADNYVVEATVKVTGRDYGKRDGRAGLTVDIAGGKRKTLAAYISAEEGNAAGLNSVPFRSFYGDDYDGRNNRTETLPSVSLPEGGTLSGGVKITLIKSGANLYGLANGEIILAETDNAIRGKCAFNLTAANVNAEFTDISYAVYDGDEAGMAAAIAGYGIRRISAEAEGYGNVYLDKIAVKDGGEVTLTVECGEGNVIKEIKINGEAVADFAEKAEVFGTTVRYVLGNVTEDTNILVCFEEYAGVKVSGTISVVGESGLNMSDSAIYAFRADGNVIPFEGRVNEDGTYEISLPAGAYDKIRVNGAGYANDFDKIGGAAIVIGADPIENADFALETRIPTVVRHGEGNSVWTMTGDKEYTVSGMSHGNAWVEGNFGKAKNFAISTRVIAEKRAEVGVSLYGSYNGRNDFDVMVRVTAGGKMGISLYGWATGWASPDDETCKVGKTYDPNDFRLTVVRNYDAVSVFVNDVFWKSYTGKITSNLDFSTMGEMRVGLAVRGLTGAVFRDYTFTEDQSAIEAIVSRPANVATLDETDGSVVVEGITAGRANIGAEVKFSVTPASGKFIRVLADGKAIGGKVNADGSAVYTYRMGADNVNFTYDVKSAFAVSGTIHEDLADATVSVVSDGTETVYNNALDGTAYSIVLPSGTYDLKFVGKTAEGMIKGVVVDGAAVENVNLDKAYQKVTQQKHGGGAGAGKGEWTLTDNGVYSVSPLGDGDSYTLGVMGKAKNFVLSTRIKGGSGKEVGVGLEYSGKNLMLIKVGSGTLVAFYTWQGGWSETKHPISWGSGNANNYTYTVIRKDNTMYALINGTLIGTFTGKINANHDLSAIGETEVGLLRRGKIAGEVTFSEYSFSTEQADIDAAITAVVDTGVWNDADGIRTVAGVTDGMAYLGDSVVITVTPQENKIIKVFANGTALSVAINGDSYVYTYKVNSTAKITFSYEVTNLYAVSGNVTSDLSGATIKVTDTATGSATEYKSAVGAGGDYSIALPDGTYSLYVANGTHEGLIKSVVVGGAATEANLDKAYLKITEKGQYGGGSAEWELTDNGKYVVREQTTNEWQFTFGQIGVAEGDFVTRVRITGGEAAHVGVNLQAYDKLGNSSLFVMKVNDGIQFKGWGFGWNSDDSGYNYIKWKNADEKKDYYYTVVRYSGKLYVFIGDENESRLIRVFEGNIKGSESTVNTAALGKLRIGFGIFGDSGEGSDRTVTFSDYSFSTSAADIQAEVNKVKYITGTSAITDGTVTATDLTSGAAYSGMIKNGSYSVAVDKDGKYKLYFASGTHEGLIPEVAKDVTEANLDKAYRKVTQQKYGGGAGAGKGEWTLTDNGVYSVSPLGDGGSYTLGRMGTAKNFVLSAQIRGGAGKEVGIGLQYRGANEKGEEVEKNLMLIKAGSGKLVVFYSWQGEYSAAQPPISWDNGNANDFKYTVVRKDDKMYAFINDKIIGIFSGKIYDLHDLSAIGETQVGLLRRGDIAGEVIFSEYNFSTNSEDIDNAIGGVTYMSGSDSSGATDGTVTATDQSGATFTGTIKSGAYTITLHKNRTYNLRFVCGSKEGLISSVAVGETAVTQNFDSSKFGPKISWVENGGRTITMHDTTAESSYGYTVSDNTNGDKAFGVMGSATGDFMISARVVNGKGRHIGIGMRYKVGNATKFLSFIKSGGGSAICAYDGQGWSTSTAVPGTWNIDDYTYTVVRKNNEIKVYVNDSPICTYSGTVKVTISSNADYTLSEIGTVEVGLALCWTKSGNVATAGTTSATFTGYSFSTDSTVIEEYIAAYTA